MAIGSSTKSGRLLNTTIYITREQDAALDELKKAVGIPRAAVVRDGIDMAVSAAQKKFKKELLEYRKKKRKE